MLASTVGLFYVECTGAQFRSNPVEYHTLEAAREAFAREVDTREAMIVRLWDCTNSPVGTLLDAWDR